jgi:hypothetical protein
VGVVVGVVGVGVVVGVVGVPRIPTVIVTAAPLRAWLPAAGLCLSTTPTFASFVVVSFAVLGVKPAPPSAAAASA